MITWTIPRESNDPVGPIEVTAGVPAAPVATFTLAVARLNERPAASDYAAPVQLDGEQYLAIGPDNGRPLAPGSWRIWAKFTYAATGKAIVLDNVGELVIT